MPRPIIGICTDLEEGRGPRATRDGVPFHFLKTAYIERVLEAGGVPVLITMTDDAVAQARYLDVVDGLMLTGSGIDVAATIYGHHQHERAARVLLEKSAFEVRLVRAALDAAKPILGICNGMQVLNVAYGGTLYQDLPTEPGVQGHVAADATLPCHPVDVERGTLLHHLLEAERCEVNSSHHQAVHDVGEGLRIAARAHDGTIEGIEDPAKPFVVGVQWHPELIPAHANSRALFTALVAAARRLRRG